MRLKYLLTKMATKYHIPTYSSIVIATSLQSCYEKKKKRGRKKKLEQGPQSADWRVTQRMSKRAAKIVIVVRSPVGVSIIC